jgi:hypothetical protein
MKRLEGIKEAFASPKAFKTALQTTDGNHGDSHHNKDLLPSPPGKFHNNQYSCHFDVPQSDHPQPTEDGDGNTFSPSTLP